MKAEEAKSLHVGLFPLLARSHRASPPPSCPPTPLRPQPVPRRGVPRRPPRPPAHRPLARLQRILKLTAAVALLRGLGTRGGGQGQGTLEPWAARR
jgi:hypothetical protein